MVFYYVVGVTVFSTVKSKYKKKNSLKKLEEIL